MEVSEFYGFRNLWVDPFVLYIVLNVMKWHCAVLYTALRIGARAV